MKHFVLITLISISSTIRCLGAFGGYITWDHIGGFNYNIQVVVFDDSLGQNNDSLLVQLGGTSQHFHLDSTRSLNCNNFASSNVKHINYYSKSHVFPGNGAYEIEVEIPNLNPGIENVSNSINVPLRFTATLIIDTSINPSNNGARPSNIPIFTTPIIDTFAFNPTFIDQDGDSLSYSLELPGWLGSTNYAFPDNPVGGNPTGGGGLFTIDPYSGHICWTHHTIPGEFLYNLRVREFRQGLHIGTYEMNSLVVLVDTTNFIPNTYWSPQLPYDAWRVNYIVVNPGDTIHQTLHFSDDGGNNYSLDWFDDIQTQGAIVTSSGTGPNQQINIYWETDVSDVRTKPYTFIAKSKNDDLGFPCESYQHDVTLRIFVGSTPTTVKGHTAITPIIVYPNPVSETLYTNTSSSAKLQLYDITGNLCLASTGSSISVSNLTHGTYILQIEDDGHYHSQLVIVK